MRRLAAYISLTALLMLTPVLSLMAQPGGTGDPLPCDPEDTSAACQVPLDTWVFVLAFGVLILTAIHLHRKEKLKPVKIRVKG